MNIIIYSLPTIEDVHEDSGLGHFRQCTSKVARIAAIRIRYVQPTDSTAWLQVRLNAEIGRHYYTLVWTAAGVTPLRWRLRRWMVVV